jgi:hypothetical protein
MSEAYTGGCVYDAIRYEAATRSPSTQPTG